MPGQPPQPADATSQVDAISSPSSANGILVAHSYFLRHDPKQLEKMKPYAPLGTLLAAATLRERGYRVRLFDAMLAGGVDEFVEVLSRERPRIVGLFEDNFNFLTKMCTVTMREAALRMIGEAKRAGARVAVNGSDATDRPELYLGAGVDAVIVGDVEPAACELFGLWCRGDDAPPDRVQGLILADPKRAGGARYTMPRPRLQELDSLPLPAWDLVDVERYRRAWREAHGRMSWSMATSRGCPYGCNWCAKPVFGRRYSQRSPAAVAEEMRALREGVAPDHVWFTDDIFGLTTEWIEAFAAEVARRGARTPFMMQSRVNLMKPAVTRALRRAGCEEVWLGVESGSQSVLDAMQKGTRVEQARSATRNLRREGIRACWFLQLGYLGEKWGDILRTRDLLREERPDDVGVSVSYPLPGTRFFEIVRDQLGPKRNWVDSDELAMMFQGTYTTDFYRRVRELLHAEVRDVAWDDEAGRRRLDRQWSGLERAEAGHRSAEPTGV